MIKTKYLIIGNSAGGIAAAEAIREVDKEGGIVIVSDEPFPPYSRTLITKYLSGERSLEGILLRPPDFYEKKGIVPLLGRKAIGLDPANRVVKLDDGEEIGWERLLLATGGLPSLPQDAGKEGVFTFNSFSDAERVVRAVKEGRERAVVIGAGLIGTSVAQALAKIGVKVTLVARSRRVLSLILDEEASSMAEAALRRGGIHIMTGSEGERIEGEKRAEAVLLGTGDRIHCDMVIIARGVSPRVELARQAKAEIRRGIVVDRRMQTSLPGVFSCGDAAEAYDFVFKENRTNPIWLNAFLGGKTAGFNMAGEERVFPGSTAMNSLKCFDLPIIAAGLTTPPPEDYEILRDRGERTYRKLVLKDGHLVGFILVGAIERAGTLLDLMREGIEISGEELLQKNARLALLPEEIRKEKLGVADEPE